MNRLRVAVAVVVALVWAVIYLGSYLQHETAPPELSAVMLAVVTWLFGSEVRKAVARSDESER